MRKSSTTLLYSVSLAGLLLSNVSLAQVKIENLYDENSEQTILRQAGDYSAKHNVLTISVLRGVNNRDKFDEYIEAISNKLTEKGVPHKIFQEYDNKPGTVFDYFIENDLNGPFNLNELIAILPHAIRRYKEEYPN